MKKILQIALFINASIFYSQGIDTQTRDDAGAFGKNVKSGFYQTTNPVNFPTGAGGWWHLLDNRHTNNNNNFAMQLAGSFHDQNLYFRKTNNLATQPWNKILMENSEGRVGIGGNTNLEKLTVNGTHETTSFAMHANNEGNPDAYLTLWASEPQTSYTGVGIGNNTRNFFNGQAFTRINTSQGGSYMRLLNNEINFNLVSEAGVKKQILSVFPSYVNVHGDVQADGGGLRSSRASDVGGALTLVNNLKTGLQFSSWVIYNMTGGYGNSLQFWNYSADGTKSVPRLKLSDDGDMAVFGKLEAKEVKVTTTPTADFVFAEDYNLPKLEEVEKYIKEKKHLPEIASAKEMEKEGVNIGEFQIKLLQKIEELTLYSIEQNKQLKEQWEKIKKLEKQLTSKK